LHLPRELFGIAIRGGGNTVSEASTIAEWLTLARQHELSAQRLGINRETRQQAILHAGFSIECLLKATIMKVERFNTWPSQSARGDLYTHDLRRLVEIAGITLTPDSQSAAEWSIVLQWDRRQGYDPNTMKRRVVRSYLEAAFGPTGVAKCLKILIQ
jgi:hypothetical protein